MNQKGIVLFTTILMLAMLTVLILSLMQAIFLYANASNHLAQRHEIFYQLESATHQLRLSKLLNGSDQCRVTGKTPDEIIQLLRLHKGCEVSIGHQLYEYLIEDLGEYPCLQIRSKHQLNSSYHYLLSVSTHKPPQFEWIQLRIARALDLMACNEEIKLTNEGILSWRHQAVY